MYSELQKHKINPLLKHSLTQHQQSSFWNSLHFYKKFLSILFPSGEMPTHQRWQQSGTFYKLTLFPNCKWNQRIRLYYKQKQSGSFHLLLPISCQHSTGDRVDSRGSVRPWHCMWVGDLHLSPRASSAEGRNELRTCPGAWFCQQRIIPCHGEPCRTSHPVMEHNSDS